MISFTRDGEHRFGVVADEGVVDLSDRLRPRYPDLKSAIVGQALQQIEDVVASADADCNLSDVDLALPVPNPGKIICVGVNYPNRNEEYKDDSALPDYPSLFMRTPDSFVPDGKAILRPPESEKLDYEGEIVLVIGKEGRRIPKEHAKDHIFGLTLMNEGTIRDWVRHAKFNVTQGKNFDKSGAIGPWIVTTDAFETFDTLELTTRVNGEQRQHGKIADLLFGIPDLIHYISTFTTLHPGDLIATGTPPGAGARFDPPRFLKPGDQVEVEVDGIGLLSNPVEDEVAV